MTTKTPEAAVELIIVDNEIDLRDPLADDYDLDANEEVTARLQLQDDVTEGDFLWQADSIRKCQFKSNIELVQMKQEYISDDADESDGYEYQYQGNQHTSDVFDDYNETADVKEV